MKRYLKLYLLAILSITTFSCGDEDTVTEQSFDRTAMLTFYADEMIIPAYSDLAATVVAMDAAVSTFTETPNVANLESLRFAWKAAFSSWQFANAYNFGPANNSFGTLDQDLGTFPVDRDLVESRIASGTIGTDNFDRDTRGFLGMEYLIYGQGISEQEVVDLFTGESGKNRRDYLIAVSADIVAKAQGVISSWGAYKATFISNNGTDAGSSTSMLYNEFLKSFEGLKNFKLGLPAGKRTPDTNPHLVEAYYSGASLDMLKLHFENIKLIWTGQSKAGIRGVGFKRYLESVSGGSTLVSATEQQMASAEAAINSIPSGRLSELIQTNAAELGIAYDEIQKLTRFLKSDMSSLLGISITYDSGDGD